MNRKKRTRLLIDFGKEETLTFAQQVREHHQIEMLSPPKQALTMVKIRESAQNSLFYLGEVLVTETKVRINGEIGLGLIKGVHDEWSMGLAIIDAAFTAQLPETVQWEKTILWKLEQKDQEHEAELAKSLAKTKVNFETMDQ